jgi:hypothetical protein
MLADGVDGFDRHRASGESDVDLLGRRNVIVSSTRCPGDRQRYRKTAFGGISERLGQRRHVVDGVTMMRSGIRKGDDIVLCQSRPCREMRAL